MQAAFARWLPVNKPAGMTSHDVVAIARKRLQFKKIGHSGTLDPDATGVLLLALGKATRLMQYLPGGKVYRAGIQLGVVTSSYDLSGQTLQTSEVPALSSSDIENILTAFRGKQQQQPPMVSAVSWQGKRLYELARQGIDVPERPSREVEFYEIRLVSWQTPLLEIEVACSAGTYIRSLAHDLGQKIGCGAALASLIRTEANGIRLTDCVELESLKPLSDQPLPGLPPTTPLGHLPAIKIPETAMADLAQGRRLKALEPAGEGQIYQLLSPEGELLALARGQDELFQPCLVLLENDKII